MLYGLVRHPITLSRFWNLDRKVVLPALTRLVRVTVGGAWRNVVRIRTTFWLA